MLKSIALVLVTMYQAIGDLTWSHRKITTQLEWLASRQFWSLDTRILLRFQVLVRWISFSTKTDAELKRACAEHIRFLNAIEFSSLGDEELDVLYAILTNISTLPGACPSWESNGWPPGVLRLLESIKERLRLENYEIPDDPRDLSHKQLEKFAELATEALMEEYNAAK